MNLRLNLIALSLPLLFCASACAQEAPQTPADVQTTQEATPPATGADDVKAEEAKPETEETKPGSTTPATQNGASTEPKTESRSEPEAEPQAQPPNAGQTLDTPNYRLHVLNHCPEGEVGCKDLSATLTEKKTGQTHALKGGTHMIQCKDGETPCHPDHDRLESTAKDADGQSTWVLRAYPDGRLQFERPGQPEEQGQWD